MGSVVLSFTAASRCVCASRPGNIMVPLMRKSTFPPQVESSQKTMSHLKMKVEKQPKSAGFRLKNQTDGRLF
jgi:hypothetical protein